MGDYVPIPSEESHRMVLDKYDATLRQVGLTASTPLDVTLAKTEELGFEVIELYARPINPWAPDLIDHYARVEERNPDSGIPPHVGQYHGKSLGQAAAYALASALTDTEPDRFRMPE